MTVVYLQHKHSNSNGYVVLKLGFKGWHVKISINIKILMIIKFGTVKLMKINKKLPTYKFWAFNLYLLTSKLLIFLMFMIYVLVKDKTTIFSFKLFFPYLINLKIIHKVSSFEHMCFFTFLDIRDLSAKDLCVLLCIFFNMFFFSAMIK